jgi:hypothetical protein
MVPKKLIILSLPLALASGWVVVDSSRKILGIEREIVRLEEVANAHGVSYLKTLRGEHATQQILTFDERRKLVRKMADASRNRFFGVLGIMFAGFGVFAGWVMRRIASEVEEDRRMLDH